MSENLKLARLYLLILAIVTVGRWTLGFRQVPYERGTFMFSIVITTLLASIYYGAFSRRWLSYRMLQAVGLAMLLGILGQAVVFLSTIASYALGIGSYFNDPRALNQDAAAAVGLVQAVGIRLFGLIVNTVLNGIAGALGWVMGGVLPASSTASSK